MIPYFEQPVLTVGPFRLSLFSGLVLAAVVVGVLVLRRRARHVGLDPAAAERLVWWTLLGGFLGAHLLDRLAYYPAETLADPWSLLRFWEGLSAFGGFVGAVAAIALYLRRVDLRPNTWRYLDAVAYAFPFGWVIGRLGCFVAFDHPGTPTGFFLGETYRDQVVRHNLGLEEALYTVLIAILFLILGRRPRWAGLFVGLLAILYAPGRFLLDFWRIGEPLYLGLTPGQWGSVLLVPVGAVVLARRRRATPAAGRRG
jgi:phosphatidylglycerol---prolipoprotein diacylglyceryl transferase